MVIAASPLRLIQNCYELVPKEDLHLVPARSRGMYVLYQKRNPRRSGARPHYDVVYIGLAAGEQSGIKARLDRHRQSKAEEWTHFSIFAVWPNIRNDEVRELEGLFRHIYRFDTHANRLNLAKGYNALMEVRRQSKAEGWMRGARTEVPRGRLAAAKPRSR